jgi:hypothetical protein
LALFLPGKREKNLPVTLAFDIGSGTLSWKRISLVVVGGNHGNCVTARDVQLF